MIMANHKINTFINNEGFTRTNSLTQLLENDNDRGDFGKIEISPYIDIEALGENIYESRSKLSVLSLNIQSINAKFDEFKIALDQLNSKQPINIICIQETWVDSTTDTCVFELPNYQLITKGKYCSGHGGLFTYVHNDFQCEIMKLKEITTDWENLFIKIKQKSNSAKKFIIGNIYRAPKELAQDLTIFNAEFAETLDFLQAMRSPIYLCGDFNIDLLKIHQKNQYSTFFDNLVSAGYLPRISLPTRVTDHSATLIDNIFSTVLDDSKSGVIINNISDHQMIYTYSTEKKYSPHQSKFIEVENNSRDAVELFLSKLQDSDIVGKMDLNENANPNKNFEIFIDNFTKLKQQCMPRKRVRYDKKLHKDNPWMTTGILKSINAKDKLYKVLKQTSKESPNYADIQTNFKTYRNIIRRSIMFAKRDYYQRMFNTFSNDMKKTWQTINDTLNRSKKSRKFPQLFKLSNGTTISDPKIIAEAFNDYFINIGTVDEPMNDQYIRYLHNKPHCNLIFHSITKDSVMQIIDGLKPKSSTGVDNISNKLLKSAKAFIVAPLTIIIKQMFQVGKFPDLLKISKVLPIYKKDDDSLFSNYRPISLLPSVSKIFERAIMIQLTEYLEDNKLIHSNQYGFRKFHSTEYAALHLADYLNYEMDSRRTPVTIHLDLSKAFDCLSHSILLDKLRFYGINEMAYNLMKNYLENRKQFVQFDSCSSKMKSIDKGVPQGSILGPLLFLIYINDIPNSSNILNFLMYADDTTLHCSLEDIEDDNKEFRINQELQHVQDWLKVNRLALNVKKTKYMMFHKHNKIVEHLDLHVNNNAIEKVDNFNFLGLHLNTRLTWHTHVSEISKKNIPGCWYYKENAMDFSH